MLPGQPDVSAPLAALYRVLGAADKGAAVWSRMTASMEELSFSSLTGAWTKVSQSVPHDEQRQ